MDHAAAANESFSSYSERPTATNKRPIIFDTDSDAREVTPRRAVAACTRCRGHKVRCTGGDPCDRCVKSKSICRREMQAQRTSASASRTRTRTQTVDNASRAKAVNHDTYTRHGEPSESQAVEMLKGRGPVGPDPYQSPSDFFASLPRLPTIDPNSVTQSQNGSAPTFSLDNNQITACRGPNDGFVLPQLVSNGISPNDAETSPITSIGGVSGPAMRSESHPEAGPSKGRDPVQRLEMAMRGSSEAPFRPLVYQPAAWKEREESRMNSRDREVIPNRQSPMEPALWRSKRTSGGRSQSDPVNAGLIGIESCHTLFDFYVQHCHIFIPIIDIVQPNSFEIIRQSPALISSVVAIAARFHTGYISHITSAKTPIATLERSIPQSLARLAEDHLSDMLLHKFHTLSDMQAIILLAAWGLRGGGGGPDAWVLSGHAARIGMRLGFHRLREKTLSIEIASDDDAKRKAVRLESLMRRWRTWLCWSWFDDFISLGFGRPVNDHPESTNDQVFLRNILAQTDRSGMVSHTSGDMLIVSQLGLAQIGRETNRRVGLLRNRNVASPTGLTGSSSTISPAPGLPVILAELNTELDDWYRLWIWAGARHATLLGPSSNIVRLQGEHVRLSINSNALEENGCENASLAGYLEKAVSAAMAIIQIHFDSSQTGLTLSFAPDYVTLCLPQAALFLIKICKASPEAQAMVDLDKTIVAHYLTMAVKTLAKSDLSSTGLSTHLSNTISSIAKVAGVLAPSRSETDGLATDAAPNPPDHLSLFGNTPVIDFEDHIVGDYREISGTQDTLEDIFGTSWGNQQDLTQYPAGQAMDFGWFLGEMWNQ